MKKKYGAPETDLKQNKEYESVKLSYIVCELDLWRSTAVRLYLDNVGDGGIGLLAHGKKRVGDEL